MTLFHQEAKKGINTEFSLACAIGWHGNKATIKNLLSCLSYFEIKIEDVETFIHSMLNAFSDWEKVFMQANVSLEEINYFRNTFEQGNNFIEELQISIIQNI